MEKIIKEINTTDDIYKLISDIDIPTLEKTILYCNDKYHNSEPVVSDSVYDMMYDFLKLKKPKSKVLKEVGAPVNSKDKVSLPYYMGSMDKIKPPSNKLDKFKKDYGAPYILSDKLDGVSGLLVYITSNNINSNNINSNNIKLYTRGTATEGHDITHLLQYFSNIPSFETIKEKFGKKQVAFRGELVMSKKKFDKHWASTMKNARNLVAGLVNSKIVNPKIAHDTSFVVYQVVDPLYKMSEQFSILKELGFKTVHNTNCDNIDYTFLSDKLLKRREKSKYIIDGIIVTNDDVHPINTKGNPDYAFAFKDVLEDQKAISVVTDVEWNESKDGYLIPTILIEPKDIGGVKIGRITGNNGKYIKDNMIGKGATVELIRSNDVIPKIIRVIKTTIPSFPTGDWSWSESGVHIIMNNMDSDNNMIKNIYYFFSKLNAMGLGEKIISKIYHAGYTKIEDFLKLSHENILGISGFKQKSAENIVKNIKSSVTNVPLYLLIAASNKMGHGIGRERIQLVLEKYPDLLTNYKKVSNDNFLENIKEIDGIDDKIGKMFVDNFPNFIAFYNTIKKYVTIDTVVKKPTGTKLQDKKIVMSGFRDKELMEKIISEGGILVNTISKNTDILIIKDDSVSDTSKVTKAKELKIKIYTKEEFEKIL